MIIKNVHGYFYFYEEVAGEVARFNSLYRQDLTLTDKGHYTFNKLVDFPRYAIKGQSFDGFNINTTFSGEPHDIFKANKMVYDFLEGTFRHIDTVGVLIDIKKSKSFYFYKGLITTGSYFRGNEKIIGYLCFFSPISLQFSYSGFFYD